ncbi:MAG: cytidylate kinase-like family protein [Lachnoclostridium sp.]|nr:cytidylate kinase-like family protein [Lachnoclostridium sp.]
MDTTDKADFGNNFVITIGRQFGSGGRELGKLLASELGIDYYDKELLVESAKLAGVNPKFFEERDEKFPSFLNGIFSFSMGCTPMCYYTGASAISDDGLYKAMSDFLTSTARKSSFVVVGRSADYILRHHPGCVNIFVHAPMEECVRRITSRNDAIDHDKAKALAERTNKWRAEYYNFFTDKKWGDAASYHLTIDSSSLPMTEIVALIKDYLQRRGIIK